jgi:hypothetical protein
MATASTRWLAAAGPGQRTALLQRMRGEYDAFITLDRGIEFQQNLSRLPFGVLFVRAPSNRMADREPRVPAMPDALLALDPGQLQRVGG